MLDCHIMDTTSQEQVTVCSCGRSFTHCRKCGRRNPYAKKIRSLDLSVQLGAQVTVYSCQRCGAETHTGQECQAPPMDIPDGSSYTPYSKPKPLPQLPLWGAAIPGSAEHHQMLNDWVMEHQNKGWSATQVYIEAQKAGWHLEAFGDRLDADIKQALVDRGLWPEQVGNNTQEAPMRGAQDTQSPPITAPVESSVSLDEIIKNMQENSK
jgi:hypothetical protein